MQIQNILAIAIAIQQASALNLREPVSSNEIVKRQAKNAPAQNNNQAHAAPAQNNNQAHAPAGNQAQGAQAQGNQAVESAIQHNIALEQPEAKNNQAVNTMLQHDTQMLKEFQGLEADEKKIEASGQHKEDVAQFGQVRDEVKGFEQKETSALTTHNVAQEQQLATEGGRVLQDVQALEAKELKDIH